MTQHPYRRNLIEVVRSLDSEFTDDQRRFMRYLLEIDSRIRGAGLDLSDPQVLDGFRQVYAQEKETTQKHGSALALASQQDVPLVLVTNTLEQKVRPAKYAPLPKSIVQEMIVRTDDEGDVLYRAEAYKLKRKYEISLIDGDEYANHSLGGRVRFTKFQDARKVWTLVYPDSYFKTVFLLDIQIITSDNYKDHFKEHFYSEFKHISDFFRGAVYKKHNAILSDALLNKTLDELEERLRGIINQDIAEEKREKTEREAICGSSLTIGVERG